MSIEPHSTLCHKCRYNGQGHNACLSCNGASDKPSGHGMTFYSLNSHDDAENLSAQIDGDYLDRLRTARPDKITPLPLETEQALLKLIQEFSAMPVKAVPILHGLLNGKSFTRIGEDMGTSKQAVSHQYREALRRSPWLAAVARITGGCVGNREAWLKQQLAAGVPLTAERINARLKAIGGKIPEAHKPYRKRKPKQARQAAG